MTKDEKADKLKQILQAALNLNDRDEAGQVKKISCRRWDSLAQVTIIAAVEAEFPITFSVSEYERFTSFEAIMLLIEEKIP